MTPAAVQHLIKHDPVLADICPTVILPEVPSAGSVFHDLLSCVIEQQIHYRSTKKSFSRLLQKADIQLLTPDNFSIFEEKCLSTAKLNARKWETLERLLNFFENTSLPWQEMSDEEVRQALGSIKGIGEWTIDMILLYTLQRPDIFPVQDFHLKQVIPQLYELAPALSLKKNMLAIGEKWAPHRSLATQYLLAWKAIAKKASS